MMVISIRFLFTIREGTTARRLFYLILTQPFSGHGTMVVIGIRFLLRA